MGHHRLWMTGSRSEAVDDRWSMASVSRLGASAPRTSTSGGSVAGAPRTSAAVAGAPRTSTSGSRRRASHLNQRQSPTREPPADRDPECCLCGRNHSEHLKQPDADAGPGEPRRNQRRRATTLPRKCLKPVARRLRRACRPSARRAVGPTCRQPDVPISSTVSSRLAPSTTAVATRPAIGVRRAIHSDTR